jgi:hypothetical protein
MLDSERERLLSIAQSWESAAELHEKAMRRNRSFARDGDERYDFYLGEAAREEIRAKLCRSHAQALRELVVQLQTGESTAPSVEDPVLEEAKNSATGL